MTLICATLGADLVNTSKVTSRKKGGSVFMSLALRHTRHQRTHTVHIQWLSTMTLNVLTTDVINLNKKNFSTLKRVALKCKKSSQKLSRKDDPLFTRRID